MNKDKHHHKVNISHRPWLTASLIGITVLSGMGETPMVLAAPPVAVQQINPANNNPSKFQAKPMAPEALLNPTLPEKSAQPTTLDSQIKLSKYPAPQGTPRLEKSPKIGTQSHVFTKDDFTIVGNTITGFSTAGTTMINSTDWNGDLTFSSELNFITAIGTGSTGVQNTNIRTIDFQGLPNLISIDDFAFYNSTNLTSVNFTALSQLQTIGTNSFGRCGLTAVDLSVLTSLTSIGRAAFNECNSLANVNFANLTALTTINDYAFSSIAISELDLSPLINLETIGESAFEANANMLSVNFTGLTKITTFGDSCFAASGLTSVDLSPLINLTSVGDFTFYLCEDLVSVNFEGLTKLTSIEGPKRRGNTFSRSGLTSVDLSPLINMKDTGSLIFYYCLDLASVDFTGLTNLEVMGGLVFAGTNLTEVDLSPLVNLTYIAMDAFAGCTELTKVNFNNLTKLTTIGASAFENTGLVEVDLTSLTSLNEIDFFAFKSTPNLQRIKVGEMPSDLVIGELAFLDTNPAGMLVPTNDDALGTAQTFVDSINTENSFVDTDMWYIGATINYHYVNQQSAAIKDSQTVYARWNTQYNVEAAPVIAGYANPQLIGSSATILLDSLSQDIVYQYERSQVAPITIYYVDADGNELVAPGQFADDSEIDLTPKSIPGFTSKISSAVLLQMFHGMSQTLTGKRLMR